MSEKGFKFLQSGRRICVFNYCAVCIFFSEPKNSGDHAHQREMPEASSQVAERASAAEQLRVLKLLLLYSTRERRGADLKRPLLHWSYITKKINTQNLKKLPE